jgi:hypothetical protein
MRKPICKGYDIQLAQTFQNPPEVQYQFRCEPDGDDYHLLWPTASVRIEAEEVFVGFSWHEEPEDNATRLTLEASITAALLKTITEATNL